MTQDCLLLPHSGVDFGLVDKLAQDISSNQAVDLGDACLDWLFARILLNEATELISDKSTLGNDSKNQH